MRWETFGQLISEHLSFGTMLLLLAVMVVVLFTTLFAKDLRWSVALLSVVFIFNAIAHPAVHMIFYMLRWLSLILIATRLIFRPVRLFRPSLVHVLFLMWVGISMLSALQAPSVFRGVVFAGAEFLGFVVFFLIVPTSMRDEREIKLWFRMFIYVAAFFTAIIFGVYIWDPTAYIQGTGRMALLFANPAALAGTLVWTASLILWFGLESRGHPFRQLVCYLVTFGSVFLLFLTGTRGALVAFAVFVIVLCLHYRMKMAIIVLPLLIGGGFYIVPRMLERLSSRFVKHLVSAEAPMRPMLRELALERIKERPMRGWGTGSTSDMRSPVCPGFVSFHNSYLDYAVELGIPGFLVVMSLFGYTYVRAAKLAVFTTRTEYIKGAAWFIFATLNRIYAQALIEGFIGTPIYFGFYWLLLLIILTECLWRVNVQQKATDYSYEDIQPDLVYYQYGDAYGYR